MEKIEKENQEFINYWEFLGISINSPIGKIKMAFWNKFMEIRKSLKKEEKKYTPKDLKTTTEAYIILSDPYSRYLHNCEIDGKLSPTTEDLLKYLESVEEEMDQDLDDRMEEKFRNWLSIFARIINQNKYRSIVDDLISIQNKLEDNKKKKEEKMQSRCLHL